MHFCGSVITHYDTFSRRLQSAVGSPEGLSRGALRGGLRLLREPFQSGSATTSKQDR